MTEKLYYKNAYMKNFSSRVLSCEPTEGGYAIVLDATAFFPEEGGQYADTGVLNGIIVNDVQEKDGIIYHMTDEPIEVGTVAAGTIYFNARYEKMQCHTAEHILCGLIFKTYGLHNVGFHLGADDVTMDISAPLTWDQLMEIEHRANLIVYENVPVTTVFPTPEELSGLEYRSKLDLTENVRIFNIGEYDSCACCAPHVAATGEIGLIKILDAEKLRGGMRIHIRAGIRAYREVAKMHSTLSEISRMLSLPRLETADGVRKLLSDYEAKKSEYKSARATYFEREAELVAPTSANLVLVFKDATQDELRVLANAAIDKVGGILVLLSGTDGAYRFVLASRSVDLRTEVKKITTALGGGGGGSSVMAQGSLAATLTEIEKYFI